VGPRAGLEAVVVIVIFAAEKLHSKSCFSFVYLTKLHQVYNLYSVE